MKKSDARTVHFVFALALTLVGQAGCHDGLGIDGDGGTHADLGGSACSALDQSDCLARPDCVADTCTECSCTPVFVGCRETGATPHECPGLGCAQPECCHDDGDCGGGGTCQVPPIFAGCGICDPSTSSTCQQDSDCTGAGQICDVPVCSCGGDARACIAGCSSDADCPEPQTCGSDFRCHARACDTSCTGNYVCESGTCSRKPCTANADCGVPGFCIDQQCSKSAGQCVSPAV